MTARFPMGGFAMHAINAYGHVGVYGAYHLLSAANVAFHSQNLYPPPPEVNSWLRCWRIVSACWLYAISWQELCMLLELMKCSFNCCGMFTEIWTWGLQKHKISGWLKIGKMHTYVCSAQIIISVLGLKFCSGCMCQVAWLITCLAYIWNHFLLIRLHVEHAFHLLSP